MTLTLHTEAKHNAWIEDGPAEFQLHADLGKQFPAVDASLHIEWLDLLTGESVSEQKPFRIETGEQTQLTISRDLPPGVHRLTISLRNPDGSESEVDNVSAARSLIAVAPSVPARELPDDWPLGMHVSGSIPPLPGFKHFRYFAMWPDIHTGPGAFDWAELDRVFEQVRAVGGRLMLASDGAPLWTSSKEKEGMGFAAREEGKMPAQSELNAGEGHGQPAALAYLVGRPGENNSSSPGAFSATMRRADPNTGSPGWSPAL